MMETENIVKPFVEAVSKQLHNGVGLLSRTFVRFGLQ